MVEYNIILVDDESKKKNITYVKPGTYTDQIIKKRKKKPLKKENKNIYKLKRFINYRRAEDKYFVSNIKDKFKKKTPEEKQKIKEYKEAKKKENIKNLKTFKENIKDNTILIKKKIKKAFKIQDKIENNEIKSIKELNRIKNLNISEAIISGAVLTTSAFILAKPELSMAARILYTSGLCIGTFGIADSINDFYNQNKLKMVK